MRPQADPFFQNQLDSLNFYQVTNNITGGVTHNFGSKEKIQSVMLTASYQRASNQTGENNALSTFVNGNASYTYSIIPQSLALNGGINYNTNNIANAKSVFWGPNVNASKALFKKQLRLSASTAYNATTTNGVSSGNVLNARIGANFIPAASDNKPSKFNGKHNLSLNINYLNKLTAAMQQAGYSEITSTLSYSYSF
jgi:hypothetical protein